MNRLKSILIPRQRNRQDEDEREKMARLEQAEKDLGSLQHRAHVAITRLEDRQKRNHWRESIESMILGGSA